MKNLNRNQAIAICIGLVLLAYLFFSGPIMTFFNASDLDNNSQSGISGVMVEELSVGSGSLVELGDVLTVHYVGTLQNGKIFDSSRDRGTPFTFILGAGQVIKGWEEGLMGMREGGKRKLIIAPDYGYGERGVGPIPPNATLIFEVELLETAKSSSFSQ